mmetsp:Transcript_10437/g.22916  ORF Transcript_10437/g.22916 Transcript_10437/m.22916 type:complete len:239 (-) Transcript_10437:1650-2366(-)
MFLGTGRNFRALWASAGVRTLAACFSASPTTATFHNETKLSRARPKVGKQFSDRIFSALAWSWSLMARITWAKTRTSNPWVPTSGAAAAPATVIFRRLNQALELSTLPCSHLGRCPSTNSNISPTTLRCNCCVTSAASPAGAGSSARSHAMDKYAHACSASEVNTARHRAATGERTAPTANERSSISLGRSISPASAYATASSKSCSQVLLRAADFSSAATQTVSTAYCRGVRVSDRV